MKLSDLEKLSVIISEKSNEKVDFKTARKFMKVLKFINKEENLPFYNEKRNEIIKKYAEKDKNGNIVTNENGELGFDKENLDKANKEYAELSNIEVDVPNDIKFKEEELEKFNFSLQDMIILDGIIEE